MNKFRLLKAEEIECRVQTVTAKGCSLLLYKTARTDADLLDETVGAENWQNDFKLVDGVLYGGIGINGVWKWDAGTESNTEAEKGRASDAFKRAGFKWGIGRELYSAPFIWINAAVEQDNRGKWTAKERFELDAISYDAAGKINALTIKNSKTNETVYSFGKQEEPKREEPKEVVDLLPLVCEACGKPIEEYKDAPAMKWATISAKKYGRKMCAHCFNERRKTDASK